MCLLRLARACLTSGEASTANLHGRFEACLGCVSIAFQIRGFCYKAFQVRFGVVDDCGRQGLGGRLVPNPRNRLLMLLGS